MKNENINYLNDNDVVAKTEAKMIKAIWMGALKGIIAAGLVYYIPFTLYIFIVYFTWSLSYNQARFWSAQQYINRLNTRIDLLTKKISKLKHKN